VEGARTRVRRVSRRRRSAPEARYAAAQRRIESSDRSTSASRVAQLKASYGPEDDLKTLLPLEQKVGVATALVRQGRLAESVKILEDVIKERKDFGPAYEQLFIVYRSQGLIDDALQVFERAVAANPGHYNILSGYGIALVRNGRYKKGAEVLESALPLFDQDAEVWNSLGVAYGKLGDFEKAQEDLGRALALAPEDALYNDNAGTLSVTIALKRRDPEMARRSIAYFEKAIAADPAVASVYNGLAGAQRILGQRDEAIANWEKAIALDPSFDMAIFNLAVAYLERGDKAKALESCEKYLLVRGRNITPEERQEIDALIRKCKGGAA